MAATLQAQSQLVQLKSEFTRALGHWFLNNQRDLPWRGDRTPWEIWVSEVMLQQTQVKTVIPYYHRFLKRFPTLEALARSDLETVLKCWEGLGYYSRARNLHRAAQQLLEEGDGSVPRSYRAFRELPGVGDYIAAAVFSFAFGEAHAAVDGNVKRVYARVTCLAEPVNSGPGSRRLKQIADDMLDTAAPGLFNEALIELGAMVCIPRNPNCAVCPLTDYCESYENGLQSQFPVTERRKPVPVNKQILFIIRSQDYLLIRQRPETGLLGGLWEFPSVAQTTAAEDMDPAALLELPMVGDKSITAVDLGIVEHVYSHFRLVATIRQLEFPCIVQPPDGEFTWSWQNADQLQKLPLSGVTRKVLKQIITDASD